MQTSAEIVLLVPNDWVSEKVLIAVTGLKPGTITRARKESGCWAASTCTFHQMVIPSLRANACITGKPLISGSRRRKINQCEDSMKSSTLVNAPDVRRING